MIIVAVFFVLLWGIYEASSRIGGQQETKPEETAQNSEILLQWQQAEAYNARLQGRDMPQQPRVDILDCYLKILNQGNGVMGTLHIDRSGSVIPIYHGLGDGAEYGAMGHLPGSSLPTGGEGNHTVLVCYAKNVDSMDVGETFSLCVLDQRMRYQVEEIYHLSSGESEMLRPIPEKDCCTLVIPQAENRLWIRGTRMKEASTEETLKTQSSAQMFCFLAAVCILLLLLTVVTVCLIHRSIRRL